MGQATDQRWVVLVHGFGANRGDPVSGLLGLARDLHSRGFGICLFDLRASGDSSGSRASAGYYERLDLLGALDYLSSRGVDRARIGVLGFSLGGAVALMTCAHPGTAGAVVADGAFADLWMMIRRSQQGTRRWLGVLNPGLAVMARILHGIDIGEVSPARSVAASDLPVLIIHGELDSHVPVKHAELLARAAGLQISGMEAGNDVLWIVPGAAHNQAYRSNPELYVDRVAAFFDRALAEQTPAVGPDSGRLT
jgi:dipeptidyl aminopeptidase/acylaminoacyl peptidase